jgi:hypothetical protein
MVYIAPDDFRASTLQWYTQELALDDADIPDELLDDVIAAKSFEFDELTKDHFEAEDDLELMVDGTGRDKVYLPRRIRTVATVETLSSDGSTYTTQDDTTYTVISSLDADGTGFSPVSDMDLLIVPKPKVLAQVGDGTVWPEGHRNIRVTGDFSWDEPPEIAKRAVALLVWDQIKRFNPDLMRASGYNLPDGTTIDMALSRPTGMPEVDRYVTLFARPAL